MIVIELYQYAFVEFISTTSSILFVVIVCFVLTSNSGSEMARIPVAYVRCFWCLTGQILADLSAYFFINLGIVCWIGRLLLDGLSMFLSIIPMPYIVCLSFVACFTIVLVGCCLRMFLLTISEAIEDTTLFATMSILNALPCIFREPKLLSRFCLILETRRSKTNSSVDGCNSNFLISRRLLEITATSVHRNAKLERLQPLYFQLLNLMTRLYRNINLKWNEYFLNLWTLERDSSENDSDNASVSALISHQAIMDGLPLSPVCYRCRHLWSNDACNNLIEFSPIYERLSHDSQT